MDVPQQGQEKFCHQEGPNCVHGQDPDIVCAVPAQAQQATFPLVPRGIYSVSITNECGVKSSTSAPTFPAQTGTSRPPRLHRGKTLTFQVTGIRLEGARWKIKDRARPLRSLGSRCHLGESVPGARQPPEEQYVKSLYACP